MADRVVCVMAKPRKPQSSTLTIRTADGKQHRYLNVKFPTGDHLPVDQHGGNMLCNPIELLCERCGHGYSEQARRTEQPCPECHLQDVGESGSQLQEDLGIDLGWPKGDSTNDAMRFTRRFDIRNDRSHK